MRGFLDAMAVLLALGFGLPVYIGLLPYAPALGAVILGAFVVGLPWTFRHALAIARAGTDARGDGSIR